MSRLNSRIILHNPKIISEHLLQKQQKTQVTNIYAMIHCW